MKCIQIPIHTTTIFSCTHTWDVFPMFSLLVPDPPPVNTKNQERKGLSLLLSFWEAGRAQRKINSFSSFLFYFFVSNPKKSFIIFSFSESVPHYIHHLSHPWPQFWFGQFIFHCSLILFLGSSKLFWDNKSQSIAQSVVQELNVAEGHKKTWRTWWENHNHIVLQELKHKWWVFVALPILIKAFTGKLCNVKTWQLQWLCIRTTL